MKNTVTDESFHGGDLFIETDNNKCFVKVNNCEIYAKDTFYIGAFSIEIKKSIIKTNNAIELYSRGGTHELNDVEIYHEFYFELGNYTPSDFETVNLLDYTYFLFNRITIYRECKICIWKWLIF